MDFKGPKSSNEIYLLSEKLLMIPPQSMQSSGSSDPRFSIQPLTILGVTGPFSVLAENIYSLCVSSFDVSENVSDLRKVLNFLS